MPALLVPECVKPSGESPHWSEFEVHGKLMGGISVEGCCFGFLNSWCKIEGVVGIQQGVLLNLHPQVLGFAPYMESKV
ncbi:hypothetical protein Tco_0011685 [Tanacetum coccineum]